MIYYPASVERKQQRMKKKRSEADKTDAWSMEGDKYGGLGGEITVEWDEKGDLFTSFPTGIPLPRLAVSPMTLAMKALRVRYSFRTTPLRMVFNSGIPEPVQKNRRDVGDCRLRMTSSRNTGRAVKAMSVYDRQTEKSGLKAERSKADRWRRTHRWPVGKRGDRRGRQTWQGSWGRKPRRGTETAHCP